MQTNFIKSKKSIEKLVKKDDHYLLHILSTETTVHILFHSGFVIQISHETIYGVIPDLVRYIRARSN